MNKQITVNGAREALQEVNKVEVRAEEQLNAEYTSFFLMLWGAIWFFLHTLSYVDFGRFGVSFDTICYVTLCAGMLVSFAFIFFKSHRQAPIRAKGPWLMRYRVALFGVVWALFFFATMPLLHFEHHRQGNAYSTLYWLLLIIVLGIWQPNRLSLILGLWASLATLIGCFFLGDYYSLWMGVVVGGLLFGGGLHARLKCSRVNMEQHSG